LTWFPPEVDDGVPRCVSRRTATAARVHRPDRDVQTLFIVADAGDRDDPEMRDEQRLGRAAFLGVTAVGLSSLWRGRSAWEAG